MQKVAREAAERPQAAMVGQEAVAKKAAS